MNQKAWDETFLKIAKAFSEKSEDESTQVGAAIVDDDNNILALGYNGLPRKVKNSKSRQARPEKYDFFVHAEMNVIASAARNGFATKNSKIYVTLFPCSSCAKLIIQAGIKEVIVKKCKASDRWLPSMKVSQKMFKEAGVKFRYIE